MIKDFKTHVSRRSIFSHHEEAIGAQGGTRSGACGHLFSKRVVRHRTEGPQCIGRDDEINVLDAILCQRESALTKLHGNAGWQ